MNDFRAIYNRMFKRVSRIYIGFPVFMLCLFFTGCMHTLGDGKVFIFESQEEMVTMMDGYNQKKEMKNTQMAGEHLDPGNSPSATGNRGSLWDSLIPVSYRNFLEERGDGAFRDRREIHGRCDIPMMFGEHVTYDIPVERNRRVMYFVHYFQTTIRATFSKWLSRSGRYISMMQEILKDNGLPGDLVYLALIESGFNLKEYSSAHACGPWQFISETGRRYGMRIDWWVDERRDPEKSTLAAARYLKDLYDQFGSWYLAAAAYNSGENTIKRAIQFCKTEDFWEISLSRYLKEETKNYIPKLLAGMIIAKNPNKYGFSHVKYQPPVPYDRVRVPNATYLRTIASASQTDYWTIKMLNPELKRGCTPPDSGDYEVKIPHGRKEVFERNFTGREKYVSPAFTRHVVRDGETLSWIAQLYNIGEKTILELNSIRDPEWIRAGETLIVPVKGAVTDTDQAFNHTD